MNEIYNMDCLEAMKDIPDNYFELAIVDPPYGIDFGNFNRTNKDSLGNRYKADKYKNSDWDNEAPDSEYFNSLKLLSNEQIIWGGNYFLEHLGSTKGFIFWYKQNPVDNFSDGEFAWTSFNKPAKCFPFRYYGGLEGKTSASAKHHPTQKPVQLYKWLLTNYAKEGDTILDTHGGSLSIAIACWDLGFDLDVCELDADYFNDAVKRFETHIAQTQLF